MPILTLMGYMGSGKSTFGKLLASHLNLEFIDLDELLVLKHSMPIKQMFSQFGERWFRAEESILLSEVLKGSEKIVALGGGTPLYNDNIDLINDRSISVYIKCEVSSLYKNLKNQKENRPLIKNISNEKLKEFIAENLSIREGIYNKAKYHLICEEKNYDELINELSDIYKSNLNL